MTMGTIQIKKTYSERFAKLQNILKFIQIKLYIMHITLNKVTLERPEFYSCSCLPLSKVI